MQRAHQPTKTNRHNALTKKPSPCLVLSCERYGIYYRVQESDLRITVFAIVDQRRNPIERFDQFDYGIVSVEGDE